MKNTPARGPRSAPRKTNRAAIEAREAAATRFEFARRHIVHQHKLEEQLTEANKATFRWLYQDEYGITRRARRDGSLVARKPKTPDEREELKSLEAKVIDLEAKILLHINDGRDL